MKSLGSNRKLPFAAVSVPEGATVSGLKWTIAIVLLVEIAALALADELGSSQPRVRGRLEVS
jgi:hypothetical protein